MIVGITGALGIRLDSCTPPYVARRAFGVIVVRSILDGQLVGLILGAPKATIVLGANPL